MSVLKQLFYTLMLISLASRLTVAGETTPSALTLGFMPYMTAAELTEKYTPLANYLSKQLKMPVNISIAKNYIEYNQLVGEDKFDIAFMGGVPYIKVVDKYGKKPLLARYEINGKPTFHSVIFVPQDSPLRELNELKDKRFAFGDPNSTLSSLVPRYMLIKAGVSLDQLAAYDFLKNQQNVIFGVLLGDYSAGAAAEEVFDEYEEQGIRVLALSPAVSTHLFIARTNLAEKLIVQLRTIFYDLNKHADGKAVLAAIGKTMTGFVPVADADYDGLRAILKELKEID